MREYIKTSISLEKFKSTKGVIRRRKSKTDRQQHNGKMKKITGQTTTLHIKLKI